MNFNQETYGKTRLQEAFKRAGDTAELVTENILWEVRKFVGMANPTDDITMIVAKMK